MKGYTGVLDTEYMKTLCTDIIQGGSNMTRTDLMCKHIKSVPVIFEPPCTTIKTATIARLARWETAHLESQFYSVK